MFISSTANYQLLARHAMFSRVSGFVSYAAVQRSQMFYLPVSRLIDHALVLRTSKKKNLIGCSYREAKINLLLFASIRSSFTPNVIVNEFARLAFNHISLSPIIYISSQKPSKAV